MKTTTQLLFVLILTLSLISCANTPIQPLDRNVSAFEDIDLRIVPQVSAGGTDLNIGYSVSDRSAINVSSALPETFPIYINAYAYGQEGPMYEVSDGLKNTVSKRLTKFLSLMYDNYSAPETGYPSYENREYEVYYTQHTTEVYSRMNEIAVLSAEYYIPDNITETALLENEIVKASVTYLGMTNPVISQTVEYNADGTVASNTYKITEKTSDTFQQILNQSFSHISVIQYVGSDSVVVLVYHVDTPDVYSEYQTLPYEVVTAKLSAAYPEMNLSDLQTEIYYSAKVTPGYFTPCYRFYIKNGDTTQISDDVCTVIDVVLTKDIVHGETTP